MEEKRSKRKKKRKVNFKRLIPVAVAIVLIIAAVGYFYGDKILEKYSYSMEYEDLYSYFKLNSEDEVAIILQDERIDAKARLMNGHCYFDMDTVNDLFVDRFYVNDAEQVICYTTATDVIKVNIGTEYTSYMKSDEAIEFGYPIAVNDNGTLYMAADYVKLYSNFSYELFANPNRMVLYTEWGTLQTADANKDTWVRYQGGVKSPILKDIAENESVYVLEAMDAWSKVRTKDGFIGYIENKRLVNYQSETQTPVTDVAPLTIPSIHRDYKINMAFNQIFSTSAGDAFGTYCSNAVGVNVLAPTWFRLADSEGNITNIADNSYVSKAHEKGIEVWAVLTDVDNEVDLQSLFSSSAKRAVLISNLMSAMESSQIDGVNIDIEGVKAETGEHFIQFIRELSIQTRTRGLVLSIDNYAPTASTMHYNRTEQGIYADYVIVMGYDEHWGGGGVAGSVASIDFVQNGIINTLTEVPANKVINAIPFYTRLWKTENGTVTSEALGMDTAKQRLADVGAEATWDEATCQYYAEFTSGGALYQIWLEDKESLEAKLNVMNANKIAGVAEWKLGFENPEVWGLLQNYLAL